MGQTAGGYHCSLMTGAPFSPLRMSLKVENTFLKGPNYFSHLLKQLTVNFLVFTAAIAIYYMMSAKK